MVTQTQFNAFREDVLRNQPIRKTINLTDLKFITMDTVEFSGLKLGINRQALKDLVRVIGMSVTGLNNLEGALGEDAAQKFINAMKNAIGASKGLQVTIAVTPDRVISRIQKLVQPILFLRKPTSIL